MAQGLHSTLDNIQAFRQRQQNALPEANEMGLKQIRKELLYSEYTVKQYPHVVLKFLPQGVLQITSITRSIPVIHSYNISHDAQSYYMEVEPPLEGEPGKMKMLIIKGHLTLHSTLKDEEDNPKTTLHLVKFNNYAFKSRK